jgi:hypothetical protein
MAPPRPTASERIRRIVAGVTFVVFVCAGGAARADTPRRLRYDPELPIPAGYHVEHRTRYGLAISGIALFAAVYLPTAAAAWVDGRDGTPLYVVPVLGPLFAIPGKTADEPCYQDDHFRGCGAFDGIITAFLIADAVVQAAGVGMALWGLAGRDLLVRDPAPRTALLPGPVAGGGYGAWLTGRF